MTVKKEPIACSFGPPEQATGLNHLTDKLYPQTKSLSSLKLFIGELLLFGNRQRKEFWALFETLLVQFYQARPHNAPEGHLTRPGSANRSQRVVR